MVIVVNGRGQCSGRRRREPVIEALGCGHRTSCNSNKSHPPPLNPRASSACPRLLATVSCGEPPPAPCATGRSPPYSHQPQRSSCPHHPFCLCSCSNILPVEKDCKFSMTLTGDPPCCPWLASWYLHWVFIKAVRSEKNYPKRGAGGAVCERD